jgi:glycosyltransferase involved in cell wall biosynthesis
LAPLYRLADLGIYVSRHEGFGIPPLECLACGTPVMVSRGLALDELWPDYPYRCDGTTVAELVEVAAGALEHPARARSVAAHADEVLGGLDWEASSRRLVAELATVARR